MIIAHNMYAMNANRQFNINTKIKAKSIEKLSSGYRINRSADDAAGLSISEKMRRQIRGLTQGIENTEDGISLCQVADGALAEVSDMLHRITELSVKSANGTNTEEDRQAIQEEISQILQEIERISDTTEFNERKIFQINSATGDNSITSIPPTVTPSTPVVKDYPVNRAYMNPLVVNSANMNSFISDDVIFTVKTDDDGLWVDSSDGITFAKMSWDDFGITGADKTQSQTYIYTDQSTGLNISFDLKAGASKNEIKTAIDGATIKGEVSIDLLKVSSSANLTSGCQYLTSLSSEIKNLSYSDLKEMGCTFDGNWSVTSKLVYSNKFNDNQKSPMGDTNSTMSCTFGNLTIGQPLEGWRNGLWSQACGYAVDNPNAYSNKYGLNLNDDMSANAPGLASTFIDVDYTFNFTGINNGKNTATLTDAEKIEFNKFATSIFQELGKQSLTISYLGEASLDCTDAILTGTFEQDQSPIIPNIPNTTIPNAPDGVMRGIWIQSGCDAGDGMYLRIDDMNTKVLGINGLDVSTVDGALDAIDSVEGALEKINANRSKIGAQQNRLEHTVLNEENVVENTTAAESRIRDTDMAKEMVEFSKMMILENVGQSMVAQANQSNQGVLSLLG